MPPAHLPPPAVQVTHGVGGLLPLYQTQSSVALIDDDPDFIEALGEVLPDDLHKALFTRPGPFEQALAEGATLLRHEQQAFFRLVDAQANDNGQALTLALRFLATPLRFHIVGVAVADQMMPAITGIALLGRHANPGLQRLLLTGVADDRMAVAAFNEPTIEGFLRKETPELLKVVLQRVYEHMSKSAARRGEILERALSQRLTGQLGDPRVITAINQLLSELGAVEYLALGRPAGLIVLTKDRRVLWVQLDDQEMLDEQLAVLPQMDLPSGFDREAALAAIRARTAVVNTELSFQLSTVPPQVALARILLPEPLLCASVFKLTDLPPDQNPRHHADWLGTVGSD